MISDKDILFRLDRLDVALRVTRNRDESELRPVVVEKNGVRFVGTNFRIGKSDAELSNWLHETVERTVSLRDFLKAYAEANGMDAAKVMDVFKRDHLDKLREVWNSDKHIKPREHLANFNRVCQLRARPGQPAMLFGGTATGDVSVVTTADILDEDGNRIGDAHDFIELALADIEELVRELGIVIYPADEPLPPQPLLTVDPND